MMKRFHIVGLLVIVSSAVCLYGAYLWQTGQLSLQSFTSWAQRPPAVGNRAAPIPVMDVGYANLSGGKAISAAQAQRSINSFLGSSYRPKYQLREYDLRWQVGVEDGSWSPVTAKVYVPVTTDNQQFPVLVIGAGSTGLDDRCAPSREDLRDGNMGNYRNQMISQASQGYIVVMPNYEGFDSPNRNNNYFNKDSEARSMLSAAKALYLANDDDQAPIKPNALFFGGYSQGGHAAFAAADFAQTYAPELNIAGIFGHGPTTDVTELLKSNPNLAAYFTESYSKFYPAFDPHVVLEPAWVNLLEKARTLCVNQGFGTNSTNVSAVFADPFEKALVGNTLATDFPRINDVLEANDAGTNYTGIPTFIAQGTTDPIVTLANQKIFVDQLCQRRVPVTLKQYAGVHHFNTRQVSFADTNAWIDALSNGQAATTTCPSLFGIGSQRQ